MRFFSKNLIEKIKKTLFIALKYLTGLFGVPKKYCTFVPTVSTVFRLNYWRCNRLLLVLLLVVVIGGVGVQNAFSGLVTVPQTTAQKSVLHVYPGAVSNHSWSGIDSILTPDLPEDAIYQKFNARNAAYVPLDKIITPEDANTPRVQQTTSDSSESTETQSSQSIPSSVTNDTQEALPTNEVPLEETPVEQPQAEPEVGVSSEGQTSVRTSTESPYQQVTLKEATESVYTFFQSITQLIPFTRNTASVIDATTDTISEVNATAPENVPETQIQESTVTADQVHQVSDSETMPEAATEAILSNDSSDTAGLSDTPHTASQGHTAVSEGDGVVATHEKTLTLSDFSVPDLKPGEFITGVQLRMSLGALYTDAHAKEVPSLVVTYTTPSTTQEVGTITIDGEVSNALNGGYFLFALPEITSVEDLKNISIAISYEGETKHLDGLFVDAAWLEVGVERVDKNILENEVKTDTQDALEEPKLSTLMSPQVDFTRTELPHFSLRYNSQRNVAIRFLRSLLGRDLASVSEVAFVHNDSGDIGATPDVTVTSDGLISIQFDPADLERLQPGEYTVELSINEGGVIYEDSFQFQWGLLSVNSDKTAYLPSQTASISLGSLSQNGNTVCDADLQLYIIDPHDVVTKTPVSASGECNGNNVVSVPDYTATFTPTLEGEYEMYVERLDQDGSIMSHTSDTFLVSQNLPLSIRRHGPSRVYPRAAYPMELTVESLAPWKGKLIEVVPADFAITDTDAHIEQKGNTYELSWEVAVDPQTPQTVSYTFDAPDISPYLYMLGNARLEGDVPDAVVIKAPEEVSVPLEQKDATTTVTTDTAATQQNQSTSQADVPIVPESTLPVATTSTSQDTTENATTTTTETPGFFETIINALPFIGNNDSQAQEADTSVAPQETNPAPELPTPSSSEQMVAQETVDLSASSTQTGTTDETLKATIATTTVTQIVSSHQTSVVFTEHRKWQIASDATGSMIVYWTSAASVPAGWTCLSCGSGTFFQRFVRGGATYNSTGGSATHSHNASGTVGAATAAANSENRAGSLVSQPSHSHTITPNFVATSSLPAYRQLRVIQNNSAGEPASIPAGAILMFDGTLPSGWGRYTALDSRYPRGENTITNGGSNTHRHLVNGTTTAASGSTLDGRTGGTQVTSADATHVHTISTTTSAVSIEPPFITVIFATSSAATSTPTGALTLWTDTPPAQWQNMSATTTDPYYDKFIKGSATYGTTGGSLTHTHANISNIVSSNAIITHGARTGANGSSNLHTHNVDVSNVTAASNLPPYVTAIFGRKYGAVPLYTQRSYRFYVNSASTTPTDAWPVGVDALLENDPIDSSNVAVKSGDVVRVRMQVAVSNSTSTADTFKLQFASTTDTCSAASVWTDVGSATSSVMWRGYDNVGLTDGATLASSTLSGTDIKETYEENNPTATTPNTIGISKKGEWEFIVQQNNAYPGATYCFRMVKSTGATLFAYTQYPTLVTNQAPNAPDLTKLFDNEKVGTTTPDFEFSGSDTEGNDLTYQIQVDNDYNFSSTVIDKNSLSNSSFFDNLATPADKDPFNQGETIHFNNTTALSNGTTYYWRVRAKDPNGSNTYSNWSTIRSFTVDTTVTLSTWFQTATEQFNTNTLDGVVGTTSLAKLKTGSTTGIMYSNPIDFANGLVGTAWGSLSWNDTEVTSNLKYTVQYNNDGVWTDIPDSVLAGNSAGFGTSPVSLLPIDKTLYTELRIKATFTNSGASPTLLDWTVSWGYLIETPTITAPFGNEKVSTTTPTFKFTTTDPQGDSLQYQIQWSTTYAFTASTTRNSNVNAGFSNLSHATDTDPFNSGDNIQFKIQTADALTNGTTYWWRVRARDPGGSNTYSFFTDPRSFTVDTTVTVSTWFQTTQSQFQHDTLSNGIALSTGVVTTATTTTDSLIVYGEGTATTPKYRIWNGSTWSTQANALDVGATIAWTVTKASPIRSEYVLATLGTDSDVNAQVYTNGAWSHLQKITATVPNISLHGFDVAYETSSGDAMVVACDGDADPTYYIWNGSTWTSGSVGFTGNVCGVVKLISNPTSDEIIIVVRDTGGLGYKARVWNGSSWGNESTAWGSMQAAQSNHEGIAAEYEESGNQAVVAVSNGTAASVSWRAWSAGAWSAAATQALGNDFEAGDLVRDKGTDNMALCYVDEDGDLGVLRWTGAAWAAFTELQTGWGTGASVFNDRPIDCAFEVGGTRDGFIMATYATPANGLRYRSWNGAAWAAEAAASTISTGPRVQLRRVGSANLLQAISFATTTDSYRYTDWNGSTWSTQQNLETDASVGASPYKEPFMIAPANASAFATVVGDPVLNYDDGSGPYWKQMSWNDTTNSGSDILYQVEYYDGSTWQLVPNTLIPGNSAGTTTSPINLANVLPVSTYSTIRPVANLRCQLGVCPSLSDWTLTWAAGINISGTAKQYDQSTNVTSGTVAVAKNGVLQTGKTGTISGGTWSIANVNAKAGDVITVFISGAADANEAVAVAKYDGVGDMSGVNLYERHVSIGSDDNQTITNANLSAYDFTNTEDIFYDVNGTNDLTVCATTGCKDAELIIKAQNTYQPGSGGDVQTYNFENNGTLKLNGNTMRVSGSWDNNATTSPATSTVMFNATSSAKTIDETGAVTPSFNNVTFGQSTSTATWTLVTSLDVNGNFTNGGGTIARAGIPITIAGNLTNASAGVWTGIASTTFDGTTPSTWSDASVAIQNFGKVVIDGTNKSVTLGSNVKARSINIGSDDTFDASVSGYTVTVYTNWKNSNTFTARTGTVNFAATTSSRIITAGNSNFYNLTFSGAGGAWSFTGSTLGVDNDFAITAAGTVTLPSATTTIAGSFTNSSGTFVHNNGLVYFTTSGSKSITQSGTALTNAFYNVRFTGTGSWSYTDVNATTSNTYRITQGNVTMPSGTLTIGDTFTNSGGTFTHNNGTLKFINTGVKVIDTNSSFYSLRFSGSGSNFSFLDSSVTLAGNLTVAAGTVTLPSGTLTVGGSIANSATLTHNSGTVLLNATSTGKTLDFGNSSLYNLTFSSATGGWTISTNATTTNNFTLSSAASFTLASGKRLSVGATFTNSVGGAATTWAGSTLVLQAGNYSLNTKTNTGDVYNILQVQASANIKMWNSSASTYTVNSSGSLYSQDHNAVDGDLYIFGTYSRSSGTEYWTYNTDFDGTALGTSTRRVAVRFASGAVANITNSIFNATGLASATTTVANQGAGSYTINVSGGTTTAAFYTFSNLGSTGLSLLSANKVTSLSDGAFFSSVAAGTALTISSTTINKNPALQIQRINFSTTSAVVAKNVSQTDGTPTSYWWFRNSTGNLDGEAFDFDTGNPGSIRWDDSALVLTVSGKVYSDDGVTPLVGGTCNGVATPVRIKVGGGGATYDGTCSAVNGTFSIAGVTVVGDQTLTVFLNGASGGQKAVTVTKTPTQDITNLDLYTNRVIVRHQDPSSPITIYDMAPYDSTDDTDINFTAATGTTPTLTIKANTELFVWATSTFKARGVVTLKSAGSGTTYDGSLHIAPSATFIASSSATTTVGGTFRIDAGAAFTHASGTVAMAATTSGKAITVANGVTLNFNKLRFTGAGGGWNLTGNIAAATSIQIANGTVTGTANITLPNGSFYGNGLLSLGSGTTTLSRTNTFGGTQSWTFANLVLGNGTNVGTTTPTSNATTTISGKLTIAAAHFLRGLGARFNFSGSGNVFVETGTFLEGTSTVRYSGSAATNILSTGYYNLETIASAGAPTYTATGLGVAIANNFTIGNGVTTVAVNFDTNDPALDVNGNLSIATNGTLTGSNAASFTVAGNWTNSGTFTASGGSVTFDGSGSPTINPGSSAFASTVINGTGSFTFSQNATATAAFTLTSATAFTLASGKTLAVGGTFSNNIGGAATTWTGSTLRLYGGGNYLINPKTKNDIYATLMVAPSTHIRMWNSSASTYTVDTTGSLYSQDHAAVDGSLYIFGRYPGNGSTDYWSYARDFDGVALGTTSRIAAVKFASGTSMVLQSGGLQVLGASGASTTIQNQGTGTYGVRIGGSASTSWSYYTVQNTNSAGVTFSGTPTVVDLSRGSFTVSQAGGSAITVGGGVISANPAKTFTANVFATTTAIAAFNVTATGTSVSSWRFTNHSGNLAGETKDVDPDGDPGYIVWDNSAANITISGHVYSDEGTTPSGSGVCNGTTPNVKIRVAGLTSYTTSCASGTGAYSISGISYSPGDSLVAYITPVGAERGATVTEDPTSNISNLDIYENRVIVRHEGTDSLSISDMAVWSSTNDAFVPFTATVGSPNTLSLPANRKLLVWTGKEFKPAGNVTVSGGGAGAAYDGTLEAQANAIVTFASGQQHSIGGSFIFGSGAVFTPGLSTTTFTTTGSSRTIDVNNQGFYNTAFTGSGSWTVTDSILTLHSAKITAGTLTLPSGTTTVSGSWNNNGGTFISNGSPFVFTATSSGNIVRAGGSNFKNIKFRGTGGSWSMTDTNATSTGSFTVASGTVSLPSGIFSVAKSFRNIGGAITHNQSKLYLLASSSATLKASSSSLYSVTFKGSGPFTLSDKNITLAKDFTILQGSVTLATGTLSVGGSWLTSGGTFAHASGTVLFNSTTTGRTITPGTSNFYSVVFGSASGGWTMSSNATSTRNFTLTSAASFTQASSTRLYVGNVFTNSVGGSATTWRGSTLVLNSGSTYAINTKTSGGDDYQTLKIGANTNISMWNSKATSTVMTNSTASLYSQDHGAVDGALNIYGHYHISTSTKYWSYGTDFDGTILGGSSRNVTVSLAANATTTVDGGTLYINGASGHVTTIQNQGSGTYSFRVTSGTYNASYYAYRNLDSSGLKFTGSPTVTSLSQGDFVLAVSGGSLITLASTTLNANASLIITGNSFATTSAITGKNVTLLGTTSNAWTFTSHTGNLAGENYDVDGATACGSIRWSNSACLLTQQTHYRWRNNDGGLDAPNSEWFNNNWTARQRIRLQNSDSTTYTNAVVKVHVTYDADMRTDFNDLRFTTAGGTTTLKYFVDRYTASTDADVWIKVPSLAGSDTTTLFMYYKNPTASSTSSSTQTFIVADDFEDGNKTEYSGDTSLFTVSGSFPYGGSYGLDTIGNQNAKATHGIARFDTTVSQGQIIRYMQYVDTTAGSGDEVCTLFGVQSPVTLSHNYGVCLEQVTGTDRISLVRDTANVDLSAGSTMISSTTVAYTTGWYQVEVDWQTGGTMTARLSKAGSLVATVSGTDNTYSSGGIGFTYWFQHGGWDNYSARTRVTTEPTVRFGAKETNGGATWKAAIDTPASFTSGTKARLRFAVENTGLQISNQNFDLEYAAKGASPSCEAVSNASYVHLPVQGSCGSSPLCMATSSVVTNGATVNDLLFGPTIDYKVGKAVTSPSYTTGAITLNQNEYTELEYVLNPTSFATLPNYCLRVTRTGTSLDTYLKVAELQMKFDPTVTAVSLNGGSDISLVPGATTTVTITGTATDLNGYADMVSASSTIYRSGAGPACSANNTNCYISRGAPKCNFSSCSGNSCTLSCTADVYYFADATDAISPLYSGQNWLGFLEVHDTNNGIGIGSATGVELLSLNAMSVTNTISYGSLAVSSTTGSFNPTTTVRNLGNNSIDISVLGGNLTDGASSVIPANKERFATSSFTYNTCTVCTTLSTTTIARYNVNLAKQTTVNTPSTRIVYWGIAIPFGVASKPHSGVNTFYAITDL